MIIFLSFLHSIVTFISILFLFSPILFVSILSSRREEEGMDMGDHNRYFKFGFACWLAAVWPFTGKINTCISQQPFIYSFLVSLDPPFSMCYDECYFSQFFISYIFLFLSLSDAFLSRVLCPIGFLWFWGIAVGKGLTSFIFSNKLFVKWLAPASYNMFLFHQPVSEWYYFATRGEWWVYPKSFYWFRYVFTKSWFLYHSALMITTSHQFSVQSISYTCKILGISNCHSHHYSFFNNYGGLCE